MIQYKKSDADFVLRFLPHHEKEMHICVFSVNNDGTFAGIVIQEDLKPTLLKGEFFTDQTHFVQVSLFTHKALSVVKRFVFPLNIFDASVETTITGGCTNGEGGNVQLIVKTSFKKPSDRTYRHSNSREDEL